jgi:uncharacterized membrane protein YkoI
MTRTEFITAVVLIAFASVADLGAQAGPPTTKTASPKTNTAANANDQERRLTDLPPAVRATVEAETKGATLKGVSKEKENGKTVYEVESLVNGRTRDLMIDANGTVFEVEEQLDPEKAPAPVKFALDAKGQIVTLEAVTTNGKVHYEGQVKTKAGKKLSLDLDASGNPIKK